MDEQLTEVEKQALAGMMDWPLFTMRQVIKLVTQMALRMAEAFEAQKEANRAND